MRPQLRRLPRAEEPVEFKELPGSSSWFYGQPQRERIWDYLGAYALYTYIIIWLVLLGALL